MGISDASRKGGFVYILANRSLTLYTGLTNDIVRRATEHRFGSRPSFVSSYRVHRLVYIEPFSDIREAIAREKQIKSWRHEKKIALIRATNPAWQDLAETWFPKQTRRVQADANVNAD